MLQITLSPKPLDHFKLAVNLPQQLWSLVFLFSIERESIDNLLNPSLKKKEIAIYIPAAILMVQPASELPFLAPTLLGLC